MNFYGSDCASLLKMWRLELLFNKKWFLGYEIYPTRVGGSYLCLYLIPLLTIRIRVGN